MILQKFIDFILSKNTNTSPADADMVPVLQDSGGGNYVLTKVPFSKFGPQYLKYVSVLSQSGTDAPVTTDLENTLGNIVWTYDGTGFYKGTLTGAFTSNKTYVMIGQSAPQNIFYLQVRNTNQIWLNTTDLSGVGQDGLLDQTVIEVRVYP